MKSDEKLELSGKHSCSICSKTFEKKISLKKHVACHKEISKWNDFIQNESDSLIDDEKVHEEYGNMGCRVFKE